MNDLKMGGSLREGKILSYDKLVVDEVSSLREGIHMGKVSIPRLVHGFVICMRFIWLLALWWICMRSAMI